MKGFCTDVGYVGFLPDGTRMLFASEGDYRDFLLATEKEVISP